MGKSDIFAEKQTWGTWEELLLACAVHRYGSDSWDSVAMELQKRNSTLQHLFFTPLSCQQKFRDLKRRFAENDVGGGDNAETTTNNITTAVPWLDELRKLRVAELRHEVQEYDLSIVSLELKVQKLKEEKEQSCRENGKEREKSDLEREKQSEKREEENEEEDQAKNRFTAGKSPTDHGNHSVNESNSTDPKDESPGIRTGKAKVEPESAVPEGCETGKRVDNVKPAGENSCNGSCDSVAKESAGKLTRVDPRREPGNSRESVAESKGEEPNGESGDVQSSASLSGKEKKIAEPNEPDEPADEELDQSPAIKKPSIESQPLIEFLQIFRSHKLGSLFERRLDSQETPDYLNLIRQHLDFATIGTRLEEGWYSGYKSKFLRDLLLLLNNAIVFFGKKSSEHTAAIEFRRLVLKEIAAQFPNSNVLPKEQSSPLPESQMALKPEPEPSLFLSMKPKLSVPLTACRKRSSITAKASSSSSFSGQEKKRQPIAALMNEKPGLDWHQHDNSSEKAEESLGKKKRSASGIRKANKNVKTGNRTNTNKNSDGNTNAAVSSKGGSSNENAETKGEKEKTNTNVSSKKRSAANFLNRMRSSSSNNGPLIETLKGLIIPDNGEGDVGEKKKNSSSKGDQRKYQTSTPRTPSGGKNAKKRGSPGKKSTGRPPKRAAAASPSVPAKRGREVVENDSGTGRAKKRSRK